MINLLGTCKQTFGESLGIMDPTEAEEAAPALFAQCRFALVCGDNFSIDAVHKVCDTYSRKVLSSLTPGRSRQR